MARHNAAELWGRAGQANLPARTDPDAQPSGDLRSWARRSPIPAPLMILGGLGLAAVGVLGGWALGLHLSWLGTALFGSAFTIGGGVAFMGALKATSRPPQPALPPAPTSSVQVLTERARRVHAILDRGGNFTFEHLKGQLSWTESALLETLVFMKDSGTMVEDLDLDSGQWVYRTGGGGPVAQQPLTLADRQARQSLPEANG